MSVVEAPWLAYAAGSEVEHFASFCRQHCEQSVDDFEGLPLVLEAWQLEMMGEALAFDDSGWPVWRGFLIELPRKNGKALALDTPIPTPDGWTTMGDLGVGDEVFDETGNRCRVTFTTGVMDDHPCFRVVFSDGTSIVADAEHQWMVHDRYRQRSLIRTTAQMADTFLIGSRETHRERRYSIPVAGALDTDEIMLPVDPYVLGAWLGDGATVAGRITFGESFIREEIERAGYSVGEPSPGQAPRAPTCTIYGLQRSLRELGVLGNKHIPSVYLRASRRQRLAVLQGLMDTDGHITPKGQCEFTTTSLRLAADFTELARTMGLKPTVTTGRATLNGRDCGQKWRIQFWAFDDLPVFRMPRKFALQRPFPVKRVRSQTRQIVDVIPVDSVPVKCIQVDSPSHLYLAGEAMVPTHNTHLLAAYALYRLLTSDGSPEILLAASSDKQAGRLFDAAVSFVRRSPLLRSLLKVKDSVGEIERIDGGGLIIRMSTDPKTLHGYNPSIVICDELAQWTTPSLRKAWAALTTGGGARRAPQTFVITTAGEALERAHGILGGMMNRLTASGDVEKRPGLTISRDAKSKRCMYAFEAASDALEDVKQANPASWITVEFLAEQQANPELTKSEFLQLHANIWADADDVWIEGWDALEAGAIPVGAPVDAGVDVGISHDSSAIVLAWLNPDTGKVRLQANVWSTQGQAIAHEYVDQGEYLRVERLEEYLRDVRRSFDLRSVAYDPRYFLQSAQKLSDEGFLMVTLEQSSKPMADAYQAFYDAAVERALEHDGDPVFAAHVKATVAKRTDRGWKVSKAQYHRRIDALVAAVMAHYRAAFGQSASVYEVKDLVVL